MTTDVASMQCDTPNCLLLQLNGSIGHVDALQHVIA